MYKREPSLRSKLHSKLAEPRTETISPLFNRFKFRKIDISVIVQVYNQEKNISKIYLQVGQALQILEKTFEVIFINDGSTDHSGVVLDELYRENKNVTVIHLFRHKGKTAALERGIELAAGKIIVFLDGDIQCGGEDIQRLINELNNDGDLISGLLRVSENSKVIITISKWLNRLILKMTGLELKDYFSGLKAFRRDVTVSLALYGDLYRYITLCAHIQGFKVRETQMEADRPVEQASSRYIRILKRLGAALRDAFTVAVTVALDPEKAHHIGFSGWLLTGLGSLMLGISVLSSGLDRFILFGWFEKIAAALVVIGFQAVILHQISKSFFDYHQKGYSQRRKNLKSVKSRELDEGDLPPLLQ